MKIGFIGAGKVGFTFGKYFSMNGLNVIGYFSRNNNSSTEASKFTNTECYTTLNDLVVCCDTLFLTVSDDAIKEISNTLLKLNVKNKIIIHMSGAKSSLDLGLLNDDNFCYSAHPLYAINDKYESYKTIPDATITIEGNLSRIEEVESLFTSLGNKVTRIKPEDKPTYHAAAVMASNLVNSLVYSSIKLLEKIGFYDSESLLNLFINNAMNIKKLGPSKSLTGPVMRNDIDTIKIHLKSLQGIDKNIYSLLSINEVNMINNNENYEEILNILKRSLKDENNS